MLSNLLGRVVEEGGHYIIPGRRGCAAVGGGANGLLVLMLLLLLIFAFVDGFKVFSPLFLRLSLSRMELNSLRSDIFPNCEWEVSVNVATLGELAR